MNLKRGNLSSINKFAGITVFCVVVGCSNGVEKISRPDNVPSDAVPAIGPDGGAWAKCIFVNPPHAQCKIYSSSTGKVWAIGQYILKKGDQFFEIHSTEQLEQLMSNFSAFNGSSLHLSDRNQLVPDGVIDFPFSTGGGKKTEYSRGVVIKAEEQYEQ